MRRAARVQRASGAQARSAPARFALGALVAAACAALLPPRAVALPQDPAEVRPVASAPEVPPRAAVPASQEPPAPVRPALPAYEPRYHGYAEVVALVEAWIASEGERRPKIERLALPASAAGRALPALQFGAAAGPPLAERPTVFLIGGLDGVSLSGCEAVLAASSALLAEGASLPSNITFVAIPWASPDALAATLDEQARDGRDATPRDDDQDRKVDEDGPDDVDGDGLVLDMLLEDPEGPWTRAQDPRFLAPARAGDAPRYQLAREGRDDDGDGRFNEDPRGGIDLDRSFPIDWGEGLSKTHGGTLPLEQPHARALADLLLARHTVTALLFQGRYGGLALADARAAAITEESPDALAFDALARQFAQATGRPHARARPLASTRGGDRAGAALAWIDAVSGALAVEVAVWGPAVEQAADAKAPVDASASGAESARAPAAEASRTNGGLRRAAPTVGDEDRAWARWLDNTRGGIGFVDWHPVELGAGRQGWVGGWEAFSRANPPPASLAAALNGCAAFVDRVARALPSLELRSLEVARDGEVCTIHTRIGNQGDLPTGLAALAQEGEPGGIRVRLALPAGARLLAGELEHLVPDLHGRGTSRELEWVVLVPAGAALAIEARAELAATLSREVRP